MTTILQISGWLKSLVPLTTCRNRQGFAFCRLRLQLICNRLFPVGLQDKMVAVAFPKPDIDPDSLMTTTVVGVDPKQVIGTRVLVNLKVGCVHGRFISARKRAHARARVRARGGGGSRFAGAYTHVYVEFIEGNPNPNSSPNPIANVCVIASLYELK